MNTKQIECGKCLGKGEIPAYRAIVGGVCFACKGTGKKTVRANWQPSRTFGCVYGGVALFNVKATSEAEALRKAIGHWRCHRNAPAFTNILSESQISVVPG